ncbi:MAG: hypothetical protein J5699_00835 [Bacteroidales bacterium]|nr:hypothetical protein [Bacteroidales bacterium]
MKREPHKDRDSFVLYKSQFEPISDLSNEQLGRLFRHLFQWQIAESSEPGDGLYWPEPERDIIIAFKFLVNQFKYDNEKYDKKCGINAANGKLGGRPKKTERFQENRMVSEKPNGGHNDNENENENEKVSKSRKSGGQSLILPYPDNSEFVKTWNELRQQPKWRKKTDSALQKSLDKLKGYDVDFAIILMNEAIEKNYQGIEYDNTPDRYQRWQKSHPSKLSEEDDSHHYGYDD